MTVATRAASASSVSVPLNHLSELLSHLGGLKGKQSQWHRPGTEQQRVSNEKQDDLSSGDRTIASGVDTERRTWQVR